MSFSCNKNSNRSFRPFCDVHLN